MVAITMSNSPSWSINPLLIYVSIKHDFETNVVNQVRSPREKNAQALPMLSGNGIQKCNYTKMYNNHLLFTIFCLFDKQDDFKLG